MVCTDRYVQKANDERRRGIKKDITAIAKKIDSTKDPSIRQRGSPTFYVLKSKLYLDFLILVTSIQLR